MTSPSSDQIKNILSSQEYIERNLQKQATHMAEHWQNFQFLSRLFTITPMLPYKVFIYLFHHNTTSNWQKQ